MEAFYRDVVGITFRDLQEVRGLGAPMVHASCDYVGYAWLSDKLCLDVAIERLGQSSIAWKIDALKLPTSEPAFHLKLVSASISLNGGVKMYRRGGAKVSHGLGGSLSR